MVSGPVAYRGMGDYCCMPVKKRDQGSMDGRRFRESSRNFAHHYSNDQDALELRLPPTLPESGDQPLASDLRTLDQPPWYLGTASRETTQEHLGKQPVGAFAVRQSNTRPGCLALTVRVPRFSNPSGITNYLILRSATGFRLEGLRKEWPDLCALVTHLSIMPEMLPCALKIPDPAVDEMTRSFNLRKKRRMDSPAPLASSVPSSDSR